MENNTEHPANTQSLKANEVMQPGQKTFPLIVIGASAGGLEALKKLVAGLPGDFPAALFIVWHMPPDVRGMLPEILNKESKLYATNAYDGEPILPGRIYIAPPDHHLLIETGHVRTTKGPKENRFRPAVDPLFRSAAYEYNTQVIGVVLSGALDDGTAGLWTIKHHGGLTVVQDPADAEMPSMPENALREVAVDYCVPAAEMGGLLVTLVQQMANANEQPMERDEKTEIEIAIAAGDDSLIGEVMKLGELSPFACPECHGVLTEVTEGSLKRFRCHTGHAYTADTLLFALSETVEQSLWNAIRGLEESMMLLNHIGDHYAEKNLTKLAAQYFKKAKEAEKRSQAARQLAAQQEPLSNGRLMEKASLPIDKKPA